MEADAAGRTASLGERNGIWLSVVLTDEPWTLDADAIVIPVDHDGRPGMLGESLDRAFPEAGVEKYLAGMRLTPSDSEAFPIDSGGHSSLVTAIGVTGMPGNGEQAVEAFVKGGALAAANAVRFAARLGRRRLLLPLVGTGHGGLDPASVAAATVRHVRSTLRSLGDSQLRAVDFIARDPATFDVIRTAVPEVRPSEPSNDLPKGSDLLDVQVEAESLADVLLLRDLEPPLAVGILGGWGTGKSFVMHLMRERMNAIRSASVDEARAWPKADDPDAPPRSEYVGHVYQIEFNAWTYAHADLWSALMQTIFAELNRQLSLEKQLLEKLPSPFDDGDFWRVLNAMPDDERQAILHHDHLDVAAGQDITADELWSSLLKVRKRDLDELHKLEASRDNLHVEVAEDRQRIEAAVDAEIRAASRGAVWAPIKAELAAAFGTTPDVIETWVARTHPADTVNDAELAVALRRFRLPPWERAKRLLHTNRVAAVALVAGGLAALAPLALDQVAAAVPGVVAFVGSAAALGRTLAGWHRVARDKLAEFEAGVDNEVARQAATRPARIEQKVRAHPDLVTRERELAAKTVAVDQQRRQVGPTADFVSVAEFVGARLNDGGYEQRMGLMRQVHVDLVHLTDGLTVLPHDLNAEEKKKVFPRGPARVVLYIDDLDRCPPSRVVEVFEAIQLLLTTRLFVVVVAIDLRYVSRALESVYGGILSRFGEPSGIDYIEKIIQIPYRTRPVSPDALNRFLVDHLGIKATDEVTLVVADADPSMPAPRGVQGQTMMDGDVDTTSIANLVEFTQDEAAVLHACGSVVKLSPRAIKRLVNVSKLVKLVWARTDRPDPSPDLTAGISLLLALSGRHGDVMRGVLTKLEEAVRTSPTQPLLDVLTEYVLPPDERYLARDHGLWLADVKACRDREVKLEKDTLRLGQVTMADIADALDVVGSFSFLGDIGYEPDLQPAQSDKVARPRRPSAKAAKP